MKTETSDRVVPIISEIFAMARNERVSPEHGLVFCHCGCNAGQRNLADMRRIALQSNKHKRHLSISIMRC